MVRNGGRCAAMVQGRHRLWNGRSVCASSAALPTDLGAPFPCIPWGTVHKSVTIGARAPAFVSLCIYVWWTAIWGKCRQYKAFCGKYDAKNKIIEIRIYTSPRVVRGSVDRIGCRQVVTSSLLNRQSHRPQRSNITRRWTSEDIMEKTRTHLALIAMLASMSLLAACSKSDDGKAPPSGPATTAPAPSSTAPAPAPTPDTTTPGSSSPGTTPPASQ